MKIIRNLTIMSLLGTGSAVLAQAGGQPSDCEARADHTVERAEQCSLYYGFRAGNGSSADQRRSLTCVYGNLSPERRAILCARDWPASCPIAFQPSGNSSRPLECVYASDIGRDGRDFERELTTPVSDQESAVGRLDQYASIFCRRFGRNTATRVSEIRINGGGGVFPTASATYRCSNR